MKNVLKSINTPYVDAQTLLILLEGYKKPREAIRRMVINNELIRVKNGLYLIAERINQEGGIVIPFEQLANFLYGPSYVSMQWALSYYGIIPERVHTVTSMTLGRDKEYHTPVGDFSYFRLSSKCFSVGVTQKESPYSLGGFLIASPEKALADMVYKTGKNLERDELKEELIESWRIDPLAFRDLNKELLDEIAKSYFTKPIYHLRDLVGVL